MIYLTIKTSEVESELCLVGDQLNDSIRWIADRTLAVTLNSMIKRLLDKNKISLNLIDGIIFYKGPGSFTGLRIGASIANSLAYALKIPIVSNNGKRWKENGTNRLNKKHNDMIVVPEYGFEARITQAKK